VSTWESAEWHAAHPTWSPITDKESPMNLALIIIIVVAIVLAIVGGLNSALQWLLWVALIVGVIALIAFLFRVITGSRRT
jgi:uncharacterized membrane protein YcjF (UPF0283 family)